MIYIYMYIFIYAYVYVYICMYIYVICLLYVQKDVFIGAFCNSYVLAVYLCRKDILSLDKLIGEEDTQMRSAKTFCHQNFILLVLQLSFLSFELKFLG